MKKSIRISARVILIAMMNALVSGTASAEALVTYEAEQSSIIRKSHDQTIGTAIGGIENVTKSGRNSGAIQKMRCWQNGILILEQTVLAPKNRLTDYRLLKNPDKNTDILALDYKNAFCYIK